ncbi:MAG: sigma-70 family RNA polymerase sigma factor, partial [Thermoguttaceae bacterium]
MNQEQERQVVRGLQDGNTEAWRALYDAYCRQVWQAIARMMGPNEQDVADVVQETFMAAARSARQYDAGRGPLWLWLYGIARNHVALHYRKHKRLDRSAAQDKRNIGGDRRFIGWLEGREPAPADVLQSAELAAMVRGVLTELTIDYETVLTAKYLDGASVEQIAATQQCSAAAVRSRLARARQAFRQVFLKTYN